MHNPPLNAALNAQFKGSMLKWGRGKHDSLTLYKMQLTHLVIPPLQYVV